MSCSDLPLIISFAEKIPSMKISKILVPVDFSDISINALRYAAAFASASGAGITILHIADPDSIMNDIKGNLSPEHMIDLLKAENYMKGIKTESVIKKGKVADLILAEAEKAEAGLIVMGTQGAGTLSRNLVGTNTTHVVGKSKCPVLAIPEEASYRTVRRVVLAVDLHHRADQVIADVVATMKAIGAAVLLVYVDHKEILQHQHELDFRSHAGIQQCWIVESDGATGLIVNEHQCQNRQQHQQTTGLSVKEEFGRRVDTGATI